eukprot:UN07402
MNAGFDCGHAVLYSAMQMVSEDSVDEESLLGEFLECISDAGFSNRTFFDFLMSEFFITRARDFAGVSIF